MQWIWKLDQKCNGAVEVVTADDNLFLCIFGSEQEFDKLGILCGFPENDKFGLGCCHPLSFEQEVVEIPVPSPAA